MAYLKENRGFHFILFLWRYCFAVNNVTVLVYIFAKYLSTQRIAQVLDCRPYVLPQPVMKPNPTPPNRLLQIEP